MINGKAMCRILPVRTTGIRNKTAQLTNNETLQKIGTTSSVCCDSVGLMTKVHMFSIETVVWLDIVV